MARALHSRNLKTTDLEDQHESAAKQLEASRVAASLGLAEERELYGDCLDLTFQGDAGAIANLVERLDRQETYIVEATAEDEEGLGLLQRRVGKLTHVS